MVFNEGAQIDTDRVESGGGGGMLSPGMMLGGGGGIIAVLVALFFGGDVGKLFSSGDSGTNSSQSSSVSTCKTGADANSRLDCRIVLTAQSLDDVWGAQLSSQTGKTYVKPKVKLFTGAVSTGCGRATSDVGPFYCPADKTAYFDTSFFDVLVKRFGSSDGPLAQEYVVAHEFGHHLQNQLGTIAKSQSDPQGADSASVRTELQADCYAGVWAHYASTTPSQAFGGKPLLKPLTQRDIDAALSAARSVGDDSIQKKSTGRINPDGWTHGSSAERQAWFTAGYKTGQVKACDTFAARDLTRPPALS